MGRSITAKSVSKILSLKPKTSEKGRNKHFKKQLHKGEKYSSSSKILKSRYVDNSNGRVFYINEDSTSNIIIIYIHGGAYCESITPFHWNFLRKIVKLTNAKLIVPAYRLAPFSTYKEAFDLIVPLYKESKQSNNKIILMGDSAGGGLALALSIYFKENKIDMPNEIVLFSPWVDAVLDNDEIKAYEAKDPMLDVSPLKASIKAWSGDVDERDWHISPLYGNLEGIKHITTFVGTREIFYPDIIKLYEKLDKDNELIIGDEMNHAYPLIPIPEAKIAIEKVLEIIKRNSH